jgi:hypothetical protein
MTDKNLQWKLRHPWNYDETTRQQLMEQAALRIDQLESGNKNAMDFIRNVAVRAGFKVSPVPTGTQVDEYAGLPEYVDNIVPFDPTDDGE